MNTFTKLIEKLEDLVLTGLGIPLTSWTVVNGEKLVPLMDRIRETLPDEIRQAAMIIDRRDDILSESQAKGKQILENARLQAEQLLSESHLMSEVKKEAEIIRQKVMAELDEYRRKAFEEAETMKAKAYEEARTTRLGADEYAEAVLASLDKNLAEFHHQVKNGLKQLSHTRQQAAKATRNVSAWPDQHHPQSIGQGLPQQPVAKQPLPPGERLPRSGRLTDVQQQPTQRVLPPAAYRQAGEAVY